MRDVTVDDALRKIGFLVLQQDVLAAEIASKDEENRILRAELTEMQEPEKVPDDQ